MVAGERGVFDQEGRGGVVDLLEVGGGAVEEDVWLAVCPVRRSSPGEPGFLRATISVQPANGCCEIVGGEKGSGGAGMGLDDGVAGDVGVRVDGSEPEEWAIGAAGEAVDEGGFGADEFDGGNG